MLCNWLASLYLFLRWRLQQQRMIVQTAKATKMNVIRFQIIEQVASRLSRQSYLFLQFQQLQSQQLEPSSKKYLIPQISPHERLQGQVFLLSYRHDFKTNHAIAEATMPSRQKTKLFFMQLQLAIRLCYQQSNKIHNQQSIINNLPPPSISLLSFVERSIFCLISLWLLQQ